MEDGTPLPVTSFHHQIVGPPFCYDWNPTRGPKYWQYQPVKGAEFAALLRQQGVTVIRIYLEEAYILEWGNRIGMFQDPIGAYNPEVVAFWDRLFDWSDEFGLKLLVGMYHSDQVVRNWPRHPYSANCGGPGPRDKANAMWYTDSCIRECQKRDLRFVIDRWGRRDSLFAIDLMPEANLHWGAGPQLVAAWCKDMAPYARQYARSRWGKAPLLTMSSGGDIPSQWQQGLFVDNPDLDFVATHVYDGKVGDPVVAGGKAVDCITPALEVNRHVRRMLAFMKTRKPYLVTETGPIRADVPLDKHCVINGVQSPLADEEYFHNVIWAHFASGASGSPTRWAFRPDTPEGYVLTRVMFGYLGVLRRVQLALDLPLFAPANIDNLLRLTAAQPRGAVSPPQDVDGVYLMGAADRDQGVVWVLQNQVPVPGAEPPLIEGSVLAVMDRSGGDYAVQFWDTRRGTVVGETNVSVPALSFIRVSVPAFRHDVAVVFKKLKPAAAANAK
ncbi:MAG: hypothetical protein NTU94_03465 [Planctomycetota bacterium]|nr:hypothetical protein [Planctomycetota bacterium]